MKTVKETLKRCREVNESKFYEIDDLSNDQIMGMEEALSDRSTNSKFMDMSASSKARLFEDMVTSNMTDARDIASTIDYWYRG